MWNYRMTVATKETQWGPYTEYGVREVYYNEDGSIMGWTENITTLSGESVEEIKKDMEMIFKDVFSTPVIDVTDENNPVEVSNGPTQEGGADQGPVPKA